MRPAVHVAVIASVLFLVPGCGDDGGPGDEIQDFTGSYSIVSFAQGVNAIPIAGVSGTVVLTATTYSFTVTVPPITLTDTGTYTATGTTTAGTWTQQSTVDSTRQATGTYAVDAATGRLTLDTTVQGIRNVIVLERD